MLRKQNLLRILPTIIITLLVAVPAFGVETVTHTYDELNRLIKSVYSDGTILTFEYDTLGNRITKKKQFRPHTLTITKTGEGTVTSIPQRIICGDVCSGIFAEGLTVTLTAAPAGNSTFVGWSGDGCSGQDSCVFNVMGDMTVIATFQLCSNALVRINNTYYATLQSAYNAANDNDTIKAQNVSFIEDLYANRAITVTLDGGYDCNYSTKTGTTNLQGAITTTSGSTTIKDFVIEQ